MRRDREPRRIQIFVQSPDLQIPTKTLALTPSESSRTLGDLKLSLLPKPLRSETLSSSFYFSLNGKPLADSSSVLNDRIAPLSTLVLRSRARGGGGDGGATGAESRDCYLNMYAEKKPDKVDPNEQRLSKWLNCALSNEPLKQPCVVDRLGNVFNKEALVQALLGKKIPKEFGHIRGLKDMIKIELSPIPGVESEFADGARFQCPISGLEFNGKYKFFALKSCGHVLSAKALKEVKTSSCLVCHAEFRESDKIVINGSDEEVMVLRERMEMEKGKLREKKGKKVKNGDEDLGPVSGPDLARLSGTKHGIVDAVVKAESKYLSKVEANGKIAKVNSNGVASVKGNGVSNGNSGANKRFKATDIAPANATKEVYASIFTSSKKSDLKETFTCRSLPLGRN